MEVWNKSQHPLATPSCFLNSNVVSLSPRHPRISNVTLKFFGSLRWFGFGKASTLGQGFHRLDQTAVKPVTVSDRTARFGASKPNG